ncbi:MAG: bifunctional proline dehydrogenase/L-glutamate gamma-semialdehyde dehydrogenase PutA [Gammaproteobacteria bacterium]|nr:bifunctional proline dehydrogenase/L-glutamate gamma-semialdehyde dehydrogenase PutA [Gammaproteobacteria bacterium]
MFKASQVLSNPLKDLSQLMAAISANTTVDESAYLEELLALATPSQDELNRITHRAAGWVHAVRAKGVSKEGVEAFLQQYSLDTKEGVILMCLAEALLRIPDSEVANQFIRDKLAQADWEQYVGESESSLVNASTWGLMLTGKFLNLTDEQDGKPAGILRNLVARVGEPVLRTALNQAMKIMGKQFVLGQNIGDALKNAKAQQAKGYTHSYDMLGEAAFTYDDAEKYFKAYADAIKALGQEAKPAGVPAPSISIKLSALHPRYERAKREIVLAELGESLRKLAELARERDVMITIDAEEADRLELSLELFRQVFESETVRGWNGFGLVVQAYSKRALPVLVWLATLAKSCGNRVPLRLVKGAYWDSEVKWSQMGGYAGYPVYTRKAGTDVSYLACARYILSQPGEVFYPQFATHNAQTVSNILDFAGNRRDFEFQRLHGMGEALYDTVIAETKMPVRIYAPVGAHKDLLPYLVRRLLENGANTSFVHRLVDEDTPVEKLVTHPVTTLKGYQSLHNDKIPTPPHLYGSDRMNSQGYNLNINAVLDKFMADIQPWMGKSWAATPILNGLAVDGTKKDVLAPYDNRIVVGTTINASMEQVEEAIAVGHKAWIAWNATPAALRADCLRRAADLMEQHTPELIALCAQEGGKTLKDGIAEVREAVDFCRYYASRGEEDFGSSTLLNGPTGESNEIYLQGRGVFACVAPWNFPLAIFMGQVAAALMAGNAVIAKPAGQTTLIAHRAVQLLLEAGIPAEVLHFLPCSGSSLGKILGSDKRIAGVAFTGSTSTAWAINRALASRDSVIAPLIAETGGQNAMIVDSSALPEQVVFDVVTSAFTSAGQRCSALRVLFLQEEIAERVIDLLKGAMGLLKLGNPLELATDVGPVIDQAAKRELEAHCEALTAAGYKLVFQTPAQDGLADGSFVLPTAFEIKSIHELKQENFGPVLHIVRFKSGELDRVIQSINDYGYGLTLGIHTRNEATAMYIEQNVRVGNAYINRNMIGATVGVQPFGGQGLSGTGPKAGGPHYLHRFATERTRSINTAAVGGNATLLSLGDAQ